MFIINNQRADDRRYKFKMVREILNAFVDNAGLFPDFEFKLVTIDYNNLLLISGVQVCRFPFKMLRINIGFDCS